MSILQELQAISLPQEYLRRRMGLRSERWVPALAARPEFRNQATGEAILVDETWDRPLRVYSRELGETKLIFLAPDPNGVGTVFHSHSEAVSAKDAAYDCEGIIGEFQEIMEDIFCELLGEEQ